MSKTIEQVKVKDIEPNKGGRPLKFETLEQLQETIASYFSECDIRTIEVYDKKKQEVKTIVSQIPYTIEGLCESLECHRETLLNYESRPEYFDTIKKAKLKIQRNKMERGLEGLSIPSVTIFDLKNNHGYKDQTETVNTITIHQDLSDRDLDKMIEAAQNKAELLSVNDVD